MTLKPLFFFLFLCSGALLAGVPQTLFDFSRESPEVALHSPEKKKQAADFTALPDGSRGLRVAWDNTQAEHFEFALPVRKLPDFDAAEIRVSAFIPKDCTAKQLSIRLRDADGEIFQFSRPVEPGEAGWREFVIPIDPAPEKPDCWYGGKKANKRIDFPVSFIGVAAMFRKGNGEQFLGIGRIDFRIVSQPPLIALETGSFSDLFILAPGEEERLGFRIRNRRSEAVEFQATYSVSDLAGKPLAKHARSFQLEPDAEQFLPLPRPARFGVYPVTLTLTESGREPVTQAMRYCYMPPAGPNQGIADSFYFGICAHPQRALTQGAPEEMKREIKAAAWCGADLIRMDLSWGRVEPKKGEISFALYDPIVAELDRYGMKWAPIFNYPGRWAFAKDWKDHTIGNRGVPVIDLPSLTEFTRVFLEHYRGKFLSVEFLNEPDHPGFGNFKPEKYVEMLSAFHDAVKAADPNIMVMSGGLAGLLKDEPIARQIFQSGKFDCFAFHGHGSLGGFRPQVDRVLKLQAEHAPAKPWYANETAISAIHIGEESQAQTLFRKLIYAWAKGSVGYNWYDLRNDGLDPKNNEHNFGLITNDFYPKAGYVAYNMLTTFYRNAKFHGDASPGENLEGYLFQAKNGDWLLACWNNQPGISGIPVLLSGVTGKAAQIDLYGNETPLTGDNGLLAFEIGRSPSTLRISGQKIPPAIQGPLFRQPGELSVVTGEKKEFGFDLINPTDRPLVFDLSAVTPEKVDVQPTGRRITVAPKKRETLQLRLLSLPGFISPPSEPKELALRMKIGTLWSGTLYSQLRNIVSIPQNEFRREPDFRLDSPGQIISFVTNAPDMLRYFWQGPEDLSAEIRLARTADTLRLRVDVTDDVHCQPYSGGDTWKGDGIQLALQLPGQPSLWEIGLNRLGDGRSETTVWLAPPGFQPDTVAGAIKLRTERDEQRKKTVYHADIPFSAIGLTNQIGKRGFRFNLLVNDNDGEFRKNAIGLTPGIAEEKSSARYILVDFQE